MAAPLLWKILLDYLCNGFEAGKLGSSIVHVRIQRFMFVNLTSGETRPFA